MIVTWNHMGMLPGTVTLPYVYHRHNTGFVEIQFHEGLKKDGVSVCEIVRYGEQLCSWLFLNCKQDTLKELNRCFIKRGGRGLNQKLGIPHSSILCVHCWASWPAESGRSHSPAGNQRVGSKPLATSSTRTHEIDKWPKQRARKLCEVLFDCEFKSEATNSVSEESMNRWNVYFSKHNTAFLISGSLTVFPTQCNSTY